MQTCLRFCVRQSRFLRRCLVFIVIVWIVLMIALFIVAHQQRSSYSSSFIAWSLPFVGRRGLTFEELYPPAASRTALAAEPGEIPRVVHRIWRTHEQNLPPIFSSVLMQWKQSEPHYEHIVHSDNDCRLLAARWSHRLLRYYDQLLLNVMRADVCRVLIIYFHGGIYLDFDIRPRVPLGRWINGHVDLILAWQNEAAGQINPSFMAAKPKNKCARNALLFLERTIRAATRGFGDFRADEHLVGVFTGNYALGQAFKECIAAKSAVVVLPAEEIESYKLNSINGASLHGVDGYSHWTVERDVLAGKFYLLRDNKQRQQQTQEQQVAASTPRVFVPRVVWTVILGDEPISSDDVAISKIRGENDMDLYDAESQATTTTSTTLLNTFNEQVRSRWEQLRLSINERVTTTFTTDYRVVRNEECIRLALRVPRLIRVVGELQRRKLFRAVCALLLVHFNGGIYIDPHLAPGMALLRSGLATLGVQFDSLDPKQKVFFVGSSSNGNNHDKKNNNSNSIDLRPTWLLAAPPFRPELLTVIQRLAHALDPTCRSVKNSSIDGNNILEFEEGVALIKQHQRDSEPATTVVDRLFAQVVLEQQHGSNSDEIVQRIPISSGGSSNFLQFVPKALWSAQSHLRRQRREHVLSNSDQHQQQQPPLKLFTVQLGALPHNSDQHHHHHHERALSTRADDDPFEFDFDYEHFHTVHVLRHAECSDLARRFPNLETHYEGTALEAMRRDLCRWLALYFCGGAVVDVVSVEQLERHNTAKIHDHNIGVAVRDWVLHQLGPGLLYGTGNNRGGATLLYGIVNLPVVDKNNNNNNQEHNVAVRKPEVAREIIIAPQGDSCVAHLLTKLTAAVASVPRCSSVDYGDVAGIAHLYEQTTAPSNVAEILLTAASGVEVGGGGGGDGGGINSFCPPPHIRPAMLDHLPALLLLAVDENTNGRTTTDAHRDDIFAAELERQQRQSAATSETSAIGIPLEMRLLWKNETLFDPAADIDLEWRLREPLFRRHVLTDSDCVALARRFPKLYPRYRRLPMNVMRADICRVLAVYFLGGIYADLDVAWALPMEQWFVKKQQQQQHHTSGILTAWEAESIGQYCNWFFAARPFHPCLHAALTGITSRVRGVTEDSVYNMNERPWIVHETTGPISFTAGIRDCLRGGGINNNSKSKTSGGAGGPQLSSAQVTSDYIEHRFASQKWEKSTVYGSWTKERQQRLKWSDTWGHAASHKMIPPAGYVVAVEETRAVTAAGLFSSNSDDDEAIPSPFARLSIPARLERDMPSVARRLHVLDRLRMQWNEAESSTSNNAARVKFRFITSEECDNLILHRRQRDFSSRLEHIWQRLSSSSPGAARTLLCRFVAAYYYGGVFVDVERMKFSNTRKQPISSWLDESADVAVVDENNNNVGIVSSVMLSLNLAERKPSLAVFAARPKSAIVKKVIESADVDAPDAVIFAAKLRDAFVASVLESATGVQWMSRDELAERGGVAVV